MNAPSMQRAPTPAYGPETDPVARVLDLLGGADRLKRSGDGWEARCPAHQDDRASLSVGTGGGGRAILKCHAGCTIQQVCSSLGIHLRDLYPARESSGAFRPMRAPAAPAAARIVRSGTPKAKAPLGTIVATYDYVDEEGGHLFQVLRFDPKTFRQRRRDPQGKNGWSWKLGNVRRVLYRLPKVLEAVRTGGTVFIVEGEKDVENLEVIGLVATCNPGGASRNTQAPKWRPEYAESLTGAKRVVVIADKDDAGRAHAIAVASSLFGAVDELKVLEVPSAKAKDASDWLAQGGTRDQLEQLVAGTPVWNPPPEGPLPPGGGDGGGLPVVFLGNRQLRDVVADCWRVIHGGNEPPSVFWRGGILARLSVGEGAIHIEEMGTTRTYGQLARSATWMEPGPSGELVNAYPDAIAAKDMVDRPDPSLPPLEAVVGCPVFAVDGELISVPGYHRAARLWLYQPEGFHLPEVPMKPKRDEVAAALAFIFDDWLGDFPFVGDADRAHALAALLGPIVRRLIRGFTPFTVIMAPQAGSGKGLFANQVSIVITGDMCAVTTYTTDEDEMRKRITATLLRGHPVVVIDNVNDELNSAQLAALATTAWWEDRMLGETRMVRVRNQAIVLITANNPVLSEEISRRCVPVRIDRKVDRPWQQGDFKHAELCQWAMENRPLLVHALVILVRAWMAEGRPDFSGRALGSFESWSRVIGGILQVAGVPGFLTNTDEMYERADVRGREWREFIKAWWSDRGVKPSKVGELVNLVGRQGLLPSILKGKTFPGRCSELGKQLYASREKRFDNLILEDHADPHNKGAFWKLIEVAVKTAAPPPVQREMAPHWSDGSPLPAPDVEIDRGDDPDAY